MCILLGSPEIARKQDFYLDARDKQKEAEKKNQTAKGIRVISYISKKSFVERKTAHSGVFSDEGQVECR